VSPRSNLRRCSLSVVLAALLSIGADALAQPLSRVPTGAEADTATPPLAHQIGFFRQVLSRADGDRCAMQPSCSTYALESLKKHGALMGWIMASDRLLRCGHDEVRLAPSVRVGQRRRAYDPVANNDFWWSPTETASTTAP
jgi:uncharacterized protein